MSVVPERDEAASMVASGEHALHVEGDLAGARCWFTKAYEHAERAEDARLMALAAIGLGGLWVHEHRSAADAASVEAGQRDALGALDPRSSLALRLRARGATPGAPPGPRGGQRQPP